MNYFTMSYGLSATLSQSEMIQLLKSNGTDVIQTSAGLFLKTEADLKGLQELLATKQAEGVEIAAVNAQQALASEDTAPDVKVFIQS